MKNFSRKALPFILALLSFTGSLIAQTYNLPLIGSENYTNCSGTIYDNGGPNNSYSNSADGSITIISPVNAPINITIHNYQTESCCDNLLIYEGPSTTGVIIANLAGTSSGPVSFTANSGSFTVRFTSDGSITSSGFHLTYSSTASGGTTPVASFNVSSTTPPVNWPVEFTNTSVDGGASSWDFGDGNSSILTNPSHTYSAPGSYDVELTEQNCSNSNSTNQTITVQDFASASISPNFFNINITTCNDSAKVSLDIPNSGNGSLGYSFYIQSLADDFEAGYNSEIWDNIGGGAIGYPCNNVDGTGEALYYQNTSNRLALTKTLNLSNTDSIFFDLNTGHSSTGSNCEVADFGDEIHLEYSTDNGTTWVTMLETINSGVNIYETYHIALPSAAKTSSTTIRWIQPFFGGSSSDTWAIDNVQFGSQSSTAWFKADDGVVDASSTETVEITFYTDGMINGTYNTDLILATSDINNEFITIPVTITINGDAQAETNADCLAFGDVIESASKTDTLILSNIGCGPLLVNSFSFDGSSYTSNGINSSTIAVHKSDTILVTFTPQTTGIINDTLRINTNAGRLKVCLTGEGLNKPSIQVIPSYIDTVIASCNDSLQIPVKIKNTGLGELDFEIDQPNTTLEVLLLSYGGYQYYTDNMLTSINTHFTDYNLTTYSSNVISDIETQLVGKDVILMAPLDYYTTDYYSDLSPLLNNFINNGGSIIFTSTGYYEELQNTGLTTGGVVDYLYSNDIATINTSSSPLLKDVGPVFDIWRYFTTYNFTDPQINTVASFQGNSILSYKDIGDGRFYYFGMNFNQTSEDMNLVMRNIFSEISDRTLTKWLKKSPLSGNVLPGDSTDIDITLYSANLNSGTHQHNIEIKTNDPHNPVVTFPITLRVDGSPQIEMSSSCLNFGDLLENGSKVDTLIVNNTGCANMNITSISPNNPSYSIVRNISNIAPGDQDTLIVQFNPTTVGNFDSDVLVSYNGRDTLFCVLGTSSPAPIISSNPSDFNISLGSCSDDSVLVDFYIINSGIGLLDWDSYEATSIYDDFNSGVHSSTVWSTISSGRVGQDCGVIDGDNLTFFQNSGSREATTQSLTISEGQIKFYLQIGYCETPETGEDVYLEYSIDGGNNWIQIKEFGIYDYTSFEYEVIDIPTGAYSSNTQFRIIQPSHSGSTTDSWSIDDFEITQMKSNNLTPNQGIVSSNDSVYVQAIIKNNGYNAGIHHDTIFITSNDPLNPLHKIPVEIFIDQTPCSDFSYLVDGCSAFVEFNNNSTNNPTTYSWDFGDGNTSSVINPNHTYQATGNYNVELVACYNSLCDTIIKSVTINSVSGPKSSCIPNVTYTGSGISNVSFIDINNQTTLDRYTDYTCSHFTEAMEGSTHPISVVGSYYMNYTSVYIDFDNSGTFSSNERHILTETSNQGEFEGDILIPTNAVFGTPLRMRVYTSEYSGYDDKPCGNMSWGEVEDYTITIMPQNAAPKAQFTYTNTDICKGEYQFTSTSLYNPSIYLWNFGDGNFSVDQNPSHTYSESGTFEVMLTTTNNFGTDSIKQTITVNSFSPQISFSGTQSIGETITFSASGANIISYSWDFGDGNSSNLASPTHSYGANGTYDVELSAINNIGCSGTFIKPITIGPNSVGEIEDGALSIYPNPSKGKINIDLNGAEYGELQYIEILNSTGKLVLTHYTETGLKSTKVDISQYATGTYLFKVYTSNGYTKHYLVIKD